MEGFQKHTVPIDKKLQRLNYEAILAANGAEIIEPAEDIGEVEIDPALMEEIAPNLRPKLKLAVLAAAHFLEGPFFTDQFGTEIVPGEESFETGRRAWRRELKEANGEEFDAFYNTSRLKANSLGAILTAFALFKDMWLKGGKGSVRSDGIAKIITDALMPFEPISGFQDRYLYHTDIPERIELVEGLSESARKLIALVQEKEEDEFKQVA